MEMYFTDIIIFKEKKCSFALLSVLADILYQKPFYNTDALLATRKGIWREIESFATKGGNVLDGSNEEVQVKEWPY